MDITSPSWRDHWSQPQYEPLVKDYGERLARMGMALYGTPDEPDSSIAMAAFCEPVADLLVPGVTVLDYGCGAGRLANFLSGHVQPFTYIGLERLGEHGARSLQAARSLFGPSSLTSFGHIGSFLEVVGLATADVAVLASVFTHTDAQETARILRHLSPIALSGGQIVFSVFHAPAYRTENRGIYGYADNYGRVWLAEQQLHDIAAGASLKIEERETFLAQGENLHRIYVATAAGE